jgi:hypothetical protein
MKKNMNKTIALVAVIVSVAISCIIFTGCEQLELLSPENINLDRAYSFSANMNFKSAGNELSATANFTRVSANVWNIAFAEPFALAGVEMTYANGELTSLFEGAQFSTPANGDSAVVQIIAAFENAISGEGRTVTVGGRGDPHIRINSKAGSRGVSYELVLSKNDRLPVSMTIVANSLNVSFSQAQSSQITPVISPNVPESETSAQVPEAWQIVPM